MNGKIAPKSNVIGVADPIAQRGRRNLWPRQRERPGVLPGFVPPACNQRGAKPTEACHAGECGIGQEPAAPLDRHGTPPSSERLDRALPGPLALFSRRRDCVGPPGVSSGIRDDHKPMQVRGRAASTFKGGRRTRSFGSGPDTSLASQTRRSGRSPRICRIARVVVNSRRSILAQGARPFMASTRRLAAILAADIVGYSRLMGLDETGTAQAVRDHRVAADPIIAERGGRVFKTTGDGVLNRVRLGGGRRRMRLGAATPGGGEERRACRRPANGMAYRHPPWRCADRG